MRCSSASGAYTAGFMNTTFGPQPVVEPARVDRRRRRCSACSIGFPTLRLQRPLLCARHAVGAGDHAAPHAHLLGIHRRRGRSQRPRPDHSLAALLLLVRPRRCWSPITVLLLALARSHWGLILRAIRGDEATCQAAGINVTFYKIASLMISAAFAGLGGALYAHYQLQVSPHLFAVVMSITIIIMVYVGGMARSTARSAALLLTLLTEMLRVFSEYRLWVYTLIADPHPVLPAGLVAPTWRGRAPGGALTGAPARRVTGGAARSTGLNKRFGGLHRRQECRLRARARRARPASSAPTAPARPRCTICLPASSPPTPARSSSTARSILGCAPLPHRRSRHRPHVSAGPAVRRHDRAGECRRRLPFGRGAAADGTRGRRGAAGAGRTRRPANSSRSRRFPYGDLRRLEIARALATGRTPAAGRAVCRPRHGEIETGRALIRRLHQEEGPDHPPHRAQTARIHGAGVAGHRHDFGEVIAIGTPQEIINDPRSSRPISAAGRTEHALLEIDGPARQYGKALAMESVSIAVDKASSSAFSVPTAPARRPC